MPIYPRYEGSTHVAAPDTPLAPERTNMKQLEKAGEAVREAGVTGMNIRQRVKSLEDDTLVYERYMQAKTEMEAEQETYKGAEAEGAKAKFSKFTTSRRGDWYKGLSPEATVKLDKQLFPATFDYNANAGKIENRFKMDRAGATIIQGERNLTTGINRGRIIGDPVDSDDFKKLAKQIDDYAAVGAISQEEAAKQKKRITENAAYDAAYRLVVDSPKTYQEIHDAYMADPSNPDGKGYFLRNVPDKERAQLYGQADERIRVKRNEEYTIEERARVALERKDKEYRESVEKGMEARLVGQGPPLTLQDVNLYSTLRGTTGERAAFYYKAVIENLAEGGPGDHNVIRSLSMRVKTIDNAPGNNDTVRSLKSELIREMEAKRMPLKPGLALLGALDERENSESNPLRRETNAVRKLVDKTLTVDGPGAQTITMSVQSINAEMHDILTRNEMSQNPKPPLQVWDEHRISMMARARIPARVRLSELARDAKIDIRGDQGFEQFAEQKRKLREQYKATPTGPEKDKLFERVQKLNEIENLLKQIDERMPASPSGSKGATPAGPITGPKENK